MNKKQFEIFKDIKEQEYTTELKKLQEDFASRGLIYSGMRNKAEKDLRKKYDSEIEIERLNIQNDEVDLGALENEIEELYKELDEKIEREKKRPAAMPFINGRINNLQEEFRRKIEPLERHRKYIIERKNNPTQTISITMDKVKNSGVIGMGDIDKSSSKKVFSFWESDGILLGIIKGVIVTIMAVVVMYIFYRITGIKLSL